MHPGLYIICSTKEYKLSIPDQEMAKLFPDFKSENVRSTNDCTMLAKNKIWEGSILNTESTQQNIENNIINNPNLEPTLYSSVKQSMYQNIIRYNELSEIDQLSLKTLMRQCGNDINSLH